MKLRNKKTGIRGYIEFVMRTINPITGDPLLTVRYKDSKGITCYIDYETIAEFNDNREEYEPEEPLIKDEKTRKAVRAWAEANGIEQVTVEKDFSSYTFFPTDTDKVNITVWTEPSLSNLSKGKTYTIAELCGEEEE